MKTLILKPIITEKSLKEAAKKRYTFLVDSTAGKEDIISAVKKLFSVDVKSVLTSKVRKSRSVASRYGRKKRTEIFKKARVTIGTDQKIDIFEEVLKS